MIELAEAAGPPPSPPPAVFVSDGRAPPGPMLSSDEDPSIDPAMSTFDRDTITRGTVPVALMAPAASTVSDLTTTRFTLLPSSCCTTSIGLAKQSACGVAVSVTTEHLPAMTSAFALGVACTMSERLTLEG